MRHLSNIAELTIKELRSLARDRIMMLFVVVGFSVLVYSAATGESSELHNAPIAVVDEDRSMLSERLTSAFYGPRFKLPERIDMSQVDRGLDEGRFTFALMIPPKFQDDVLANRQPTIQVNIDATRMTQAFVGATYIQNIVQGEINEFISGYRAKTELPIQQVTRVIFNPNLTGTWFGGVVEIINHITMFSIILAGAAVIREREHGTLEHLLVMPVVPAEIMVAKILASGLVVLVCAALSLRYIVQGILSVPIAGSVPLFLLAAALHLFSATSMGICLATVARSMPQFGLLIILVILPLELLSGGVTPRESMPQFVQNVMLVAPTTHFVSMAKSILFRGAGIMTVWPQLLAIVGIGAVFFSIALARFRNSVTTAQA